MALVQARRILRKVGQGRPLTIKPKVSVIGEFWAMTTEGDGNYGLQRFLEQEGAEVDIQIVTNWLLYNIWEHRWDTKQRMTLRAEDAGRKGLAGTNPQKKLAILFVAEHGGARPVPDLRRNHRRLHDYPLPHGRRRHRARTSTQPPARRRRPHGGRQEADPQCVAQKATMTLSVKPLRLHALGVSDGVQSFVTEKWPGRSSCRSRPPAMARSTSTAACR